MKQKGFTLVEILVVSMIIGILAATAIPSYNQYIIVTSDKTCEHTASTVLTVVITFMQSVDPGLTGTYDTIKDLNLKLGKSGIKLPNGFEASTNIISKDNITVFVQDGEYMGTATLDTSL